ncbi:MAG: hypothetical protein ABSF71_06945 [Terriglobia bacterium]|jgi:hypothetical protein
MICPLCGNALTESFCARCGADTGGLDSGLSPFEHDARRLREMEFNDVVQKFRSTIQRMPDRYVLYGNGAIGSDLL